jgi:hypothetical protein
MRHLFIATSLMLTALMTATFVPAPGLAQGQSPQAPLPPGGFKPPPMPPVKPYQAVAVTPPGRYDDPSFAAFRKQLADIAQHKDRAALAKLVVAQGFFWMQDKDLADKHKSGIANLATAIDLDAKDGSGWDALAGYANDPTGGPLPDHPGVICAPADPSIDPKAFEALLQATQTEPPEWAYPITDGVEMRSVPKPNAPVVEKLGLTLVRVLPDTAPPQDPSQAAFVHVAAPSGKSGFVLADSFSGLGADQMCYANEASGWKIAGYFGGAAQ